MTLLSTTVLLCLVLDPIGNMPLFAVALGRVEQTKGTARACAVIIREACIGLAVLLLFLFAGRFLLDLLQVSRGSLGVAGGVILFLIAIKMVFSSLSELIGEDLDAEPFIVPLAIPSIAGPGAMAIVTLLMAGEPQRWIEWTIALLAAWAVTTALLLLAPLFSRVLGKRGLLAVERLMGLLLTTIAVQMLITGIRQSFFTP